MIGPERHLEGEDGTDAHFGPDLDVVSEQPGNPVHCGEPKAETAGAVTGWIVQLPEILEDFGELVLGDAPPGVGYLKQSGTRLFAAFDGDATAFGILIALEIRLRRMSSSKRGSLDTISGAGGT